MTCAGLFEMLSNLLKEASKLSEEKGIELRDAIYMLVSKPAPTGS